MDLDKLKRLRFWTPPILLIVGAFLLGIFTREWDVLIPKSIDDAQFFIIAFVLGLIYYMTPFRNKANQSYHEKVQKNIIENLLRVSGVQPHNKYTWKKVKVIFFDLIDNDASLAVKSKLVMENGFYWTLAADLRVISIFYAAISFFVYYGFKGNDGGLVSFAFFAALIGLSTVGSRMLTDRHLKLGSEQIEIIEYKYLNKLKTELGKI